MISHRRLVASPRARDEVVGDAEDVEPVPAVEVDELAERKGAVAPPGVRVELAEQRIASTPFHALTPGTKVPGFPKKM